MEMAPLVSPEHDNMSVREVSPLVSASKSYFNKIRRSKLCHIVVSLLIAAGLVSTTIYVIDSTDRHVTLTTTYTPETKSPPKDYTDHTVTLTTIYAPETTSPHQDSTDRHVTLTTTYTPETTSPHQDSTDHPVTLTTIYAPETTSPHKDSTDRLVTLTTAHTPESTSPPQGKPLSERHVQKLRKFSIKTPSDTFDDCYPIGVVYLPDGRIVVADYNNQKLKLFREEGQYLDEMKVRGHPYDMCLVDNNTVAVAVDSRPGSIHVMHVGSSKLSLSNEINIFNDESCKGITYTNGKFFVSSGLGGGVYSVMENGTADLLHDYDTRVTYLANDPSNQGQLLVSLHTRTDGDVAVSRLSENRSPTNVLKVGAMRGAVGIDVDREGNIYVCGEESNNLVQMSSHGSNVRELLTNDGINTPEAIAVSGDKLVVTYSYDDFIQVFQLC